MVLQNLTIGGCCVLLVSLVQENVLLSTLASSSEEPWPLPLLFLPFPVLRILSHPPGLLFSFLDCVV